MPFTGVIDSEQLGVLTEALRSYCEAVQIEPNSPAYFEAGRRAIVLFENGVTSAEDLAAALRKEMPEIKRELWQGMESYGNRISNEPG